MSTSFKTTKNELIEFLNNQQNGLFLICSAKETEQYSYEQRCDAKSWGPSGPVRLNDQRSGLIFGSDIVKDANQLEAFRVVYDFSPYGYLIYIKLRFSGAPGTHDSNSENYLLNKEDPPCAAKNIGNLFKLIIEWSKTKDHPWDNSIDPLSDICSNFIKHTNMPSSLVEYIDSNYQDMQVYRYLKGNTDARNQEKINNQIDQDALNWFIGILPEE